MSLTLIAFIATALRRQMARAAMLSLNFTKRGVYAFPYAHPNIRRNRNKHELEAIDPEGLVGRRNFSDRIQLGFGDAIP